MNRKLFLAIIMISLMGGLYAQLQWQEEGIAINNDYPLYWYINGGMVESGISYFVWSESQSGSPDLLMQGYDTLGNPVWTEDLIICDAPKYQGRAQVISSSDGNLIIAWHDTRNLPGLWFGEEYEIYLQKITPEGEILWQDNGIQVGLCYPYDYEIISDDAGGCFLGFRSAEDEAASTSFWHIDSEGSHYPGWEEGLSFESGYSYYKMISSGVGELIIYTMNEEGPLVRKLSASGSLIWDGIAVSDLSAYNSFLYQREFSTDLIFNSYDGIYLEQIDLEGNLMSTEPQTIYSGEEYLSSLRCSQAAEGYFIFFSEHNTGNVLLKTDNSGILQWDQILNFGQIMDIKGMNNGNVRIWNQDANSFAIREYDGEGNLLSPSEGWWQYNFSEDYCYWQFGVFSDGEITSCGWRETTTEQENEPFICQIIEEDGATVFAASGFNAATGRNSGQICKGFYKYNDMIITLLESWYMPEQRMIMKTFDENGQITGDYEGMIISDEEAGCVMPLGINGDRLYFVMEYSAYPEYQIPELRLNAIDLRGEPSLVWDIEGIVLGEGEFINTTINMTTIPEEENALLFTWNVDSPHGWVNAQKLVNDEFVWQAGGVAYAGPDTDTHRVFCYNDYVLRMISWGNGWWLNRIDDAGEMLWADELAFATGIMYDKPYAIPLANGNMLFLYAEYTTNGLQLVEHRITEEGEDLSGASGDVVSFLNGAERMKIFDQGDNYRLLCEMDDDSYRLYQFDYAGNAISEPVSISGYEHYNLMASEIHQEHLALFSVTSYGGLQLGLTDLEGEASDLLPGYPYQFLDYGNYTYYTHTTVDEENIYFCWLDGGTSERPDEGEYGWNWKMQKLRIPSTSADPADIPNVISASIYPNPFNPELQISWNIPNPSEANIEAAIYNIKGQEIKSWQDLKSEENLIWRGRDANGKACSSGIYFVRINCGGSSVSHKAVLLK